MTATLPQAEAFTFGMEKVPATDKDSLTVAGPFPPRILDLLRYVAERNPPEGLGPYEDENGEPMQDDADAALRWLTAAQSALLAQAAEKDAEIERLRKRLDQIQDAGAALANIAFNLAQHPGKALIQRECDIISQCRKDWDAAIDASRALAQKEKTWAPSQTSARSWKPRRRWSRPATRTRATSRRT